MKKPKKKHTPKWYVNAPALCECKECNVASSEGEWRKRMPERTVERILNAHERQKKVKK